MRALPWIAGSSGINGTPNFDILSWDFSFRCHLWFKIFMVLFLPLDPIAVSDNSEKLQPTTFRKRLESVLGQLQTF